MDLKCKINGKEHKIVQGTPFSDEFNETLDSASIIIPHCKGKLDIYPYDDVYIYNEDKSFYKHFLIHQFNEENINLVDKIYTYKIQLFSETKGLETVQLPNISVTQAVYIDKKKSVYQYICDFVNLYNPKLKFVKDKNQKTWEYKGRYKIANTSCIPRNSLLENNLSEIFGNVFAPEFTLNGPNLRDLLAKLFLVKDMIPVVEDNIIYAMDITKRHGDFNIEGVNYISSSRSSENHCDNLRRTYYDALSQNYSARRVELLGFRNSDTSLMTIENMRIETNFPIYKINKVYMCYYKKGVVKITNADFFDGDKIYAVGDFVKVPRTGNLVDYYECLVPGQYNFSDLLNTAKWKLNNKTKVFLCKQDITPLVKLNSERELLSKDWNDFEEVYPNAFPSNGFNGINNIEDIAQFKLCTVGYDIGSKYITGWGEKYTYPKGFWDVTKTYIQNIAVIMDSIYPYGIYTKAYLTSDLSPNEDFFVENGANFFFDNIVSPVFKSEIIDLKIAASISAENLADVNDSIKMKSLFFEIDYNAFNSGTVVHTKDIGRDIITNNDNSSSSLTILEEDGLYQKEKINRFGNKAYVINARYNNISQLQSLGSVYCDDEIDDVIIYHREYSISDNVVIATYYGMHDYVLKNYFTSVYAKHRPYSLMSYGESIRRSENNKTLFMLSKDELYYENIEDYDKDDLIDKVFSFYKKSLKPDTYNVNKTPDKINYGYITHELNDVVNYYATDVNAFVSGPSLCFNMSMYDNVSMGVYIKKAMPDFSFSDVSSIIDITGDYTGSVQDWYLAVDDTETGFTEKMGFYVAHVDKEEEFSDKVLDYNEYSQKITDAINKLILLPKIDEKAIANANNKIGNVYKINKDNKEIVDMTFQFEPITTDKDVMFSQWLMKLSDLLSSYNKRTEDVRVIETIMQSEKSKIYYSHNSEYYPTFILEIDQENFNALKSLDDDKKDNIKISGVLESTDVTESVDELNAITYFKMTFQKIKIIEEDSKEKVELIGLLEMKINRAKGNYKIVTNDAILTLTKNTTGFSNTLDYPNTEQCYYFTNYDFFNAQALNDIYFKNEKNETEILGENNMFGFEFGKDMVFNSDSQISVIDMSKQNISIADSDSLDKIKEYLNSKNMFLALNKEKMKKTIVYNEYKANKTITNNENDEIETDVPIFRLSTAKVNDNDYYQNLINSSEYNSQIGAPIVSNFVYEIIDEHSAKISFDVTNPNNEVMLLVLEGPGITYENNLYIKSLFGNETGKIENLICYENKPFYYLTLFTKENEITYRGIQKIFSPDIDSLGVTNPIEMKVENVSIETEYTTILYNKMNLKICNSNNFPVQCLVKVNDKIDVYDFSANEQKELSYYINDNTSISVCFRKEGAYSQSAWTFIEASSLKEIHYEYCSDYLSFIDAPVDEIIFVEIDPLTNKPYIKIDLNNEKYPIDSENKSIQYWFRDEESEAFKFVFGVNLTDEDFANGFVKIYISAIKSRDNRVFDENFDVIGKIVNFADNNIEKTYGEDQYYCDIIE